MNEPSIIILEFVGGIHDGATLVAEDPSRGIHLDVWDESDRAIAVFRDTNGGRTGTRFSVHSDHMHYPRHKYPYHQQVTIHGVRHIMQTDVEQYAEHEYQITDCLTHDDEVLIRAEYVGSSKTASMSWGRISRTLPPKN